MRFEIDIKKKLGEFHLQTSFATEDTINAVLGASGSGKSLLLKCIAGIETPDEGYIRLNGDILFDSKRHINLPPQKRKIGYMFQDYALFPNMTVRENVEIGLKGQSIDPDFFERFHISDILTLYPYQLSGGQKQRTAMARMLAVKPEMILLDEPFSALDSHLRWQIEKEVKQTLLAEKKPTIFVSHSRDEVYRLSEYVGVMTEGELSGLRKTKELFENPRTCSEAILSGCKNILKAVRAGEKEVVVPDFGINLKTLNDIPFDNGYIGIRAHNFRICEGTKEYINCIEIKSVEIEEEPFEWNVSIYTPASTIPIQWRVSKDTLSYEEIKSIGRLWIKPDQVLTFRD